MKSIGFTKVVWSIIVGLMAVLPVQSHSEREKTHQNPSHLKELLNNANYTEAIAFIKKRLEEIDPSTAYVDEK